MIPPTSLSHYYNKLGLVPEDPEDSLVQVQDAKSYVGTL